MKKNCLYVVLGMVLALHFVTSVFAEGATAHSANQSSADLAKQLQNPVANLISVPFQNNWDFGIGSTDSMRYTVNIQPVIPFSLGEEWNLITRTILPITHA